MTLPRKEPPYWPVGSLLRGHTGQVFLLVAEAPADLAQRHVVIEVYPSRGLATPTTVWPWSYEGHYSLRRVA